MKIITSALVALLVIASVAGTAGAFDAKTFYEQIDRTKSDQMPWNGRNTQAISRSSTHKRRSAPGASLVFSGAYETF